MTKRSQGGIGPGSIDAESMGYAAVWAGVDGLACVGRKSGNLIGHGNDGGIDGHRSTQVYRPNALSRNRQS